MEDVFKEINGRVNIRQIVEFYHEPLNRSGMVHCPLHDDRTPSLSVNEKENMFKCFSAGCDFAGDGIKFVAKLKNVDNLEAAKIINQDFNLGINFDHKELNDKQLKIRQYILDCQKHLEECNYLQGRCLTLQTLKQFGVGYDPKKKAVVIPYSSSYTYYQLRYVETKGFYKPKTEDAGPEPIWNETALRKVSKRAIFVVESPICAMSIMQYGSVAVALCGKGNFDRLIEIYKKAKNVAPLILCLDNDEAGQTASAELMEKLKDNDIKALQFNIATSYKDPNELLQHSADKLCERLHQGNLQGSKLLRGPTDVITGEDLFELELPPIKWIVKDLLPEGLAIIVASSKLGKSWMMMQLAHAIVEQEDFLGKPTTHAKVLYYALEDRDRRIKTRMNIIWKGKKPSPGVMFKTESKRLDDGLIKELETILKANKGIKLIIFDTFQLIRGAAQKNESAYANDYREMSILKHFADKHEICIILVHHTRKMLDENDVFNMTSGSTAIMGASDTAMIIYKKKRMDEDATLSITGRDVFSTEITINKDAENGRWSVVDSPEQKERMRRDNEFRSNPITKTLLALLKKQSSGWSGTVRQLRNECYDYLHEPLADSDTNIGRYLSSEDFERRIYQETRCEHTTKRKTNGVIHTFAPKQRTLEDYYSNN